MLKVRTNCHIATSLKAVIREVFGFASKLFRKKHDLTKVQFDLKDSAITQALFLCLALCFSPISHAATAAGEALFDHTKTGFILKDVHTTLRCEQCHLDGIFKNTPKDCAGCHTTGSRIGASPKPINHVQTTETCDTCHSSASSFQVKSFTHAGIASGEAGNCESCHNGQSQGVTSKPANHFPTLQPCGLCHTNTVEFRSWTMDHKGLVSNCVSCHGATAELYPGVVFKPVAHIPTTAACETCHPSTKFDNFNGASFIHTTSGANNVKSNCKTCHAGQYKGVTVKHAGHIYDANVQCDVCHTSANTNGYTSFLGAKYNHVTATTPPALGNCFRCHDGATVKATKKTSTHIVTTAACDSCHTRANTSNYTTFKGGSYTHSNPAGVCSTCHNGATAKGVAAAVPTHVATTAACDTCHANAVTAGYTSFVGAVYIHASPAGVCSSCHAGTSGTAFGSRLALGKSTNHVVTTATCDTCHNQTNTSNYTTFKGALYVHATPPGVCSSCHKPGGPGLDKSVNHVPIGTSACDKCHTQSNTSNYTTFYGAIFVHASPMLDRCDSCHFTSGPGKAKTFIPNHVPTTEDCAVCHTTATIANYTTFTGALYIHPSPITACAACHNGTIAITKSAVHVPIGSAACETCHDAKNFKTFFGITFHPAGNSAGCATCHTGIVATGKSVTHIPTSPSAGCETCHDNATTGVFNSFLGVKYHTPANITPGVCSTCHNGIFATGKSTAHVTTSEPCVTCHTATNTSNYKTFFGAVYVHPADALVLGCETCHKLGGAGIPKNSTHVPTGIRPCAECHTQTNTGNYQSFLGGVYAHTPETTCKRCHDGVQALGIPSYTFHQQANYKIDECVPCHAVSTGTYKSFFGAIFTHPDTNLAVNKVCSTCHDGTQAKGMSVFHIPTNGVGCESCHNSGNTTNFTTFLGAKFHPTGNSTGCSNCHNGRTATGKNAVTHVPTTAACDTCHANAKTSYLNWTGSTYIHASPAGVCSTCHGSINGSSVIFGTVTTVGKPLNHVTTTEDCGTCHANSIAVGTGGFSVWNYIHPATATPCENCHDGRTFGTVTPKPKSAAIPPHYQTTLPCDQCHTKANTSNYSNFLNATYTHTNPAGTCSNCHNDVNAKGKSVFHTATTAACDTCHFNETSGGRDFSSFLVHVTYNHPTTPGACATCHNGVKARGMTVATHIPTNSAACETCHKNATTGVFTSFLGAKYHIAGNTPGICSTCHNGTFAKGTSFATPNHVPTTALCDTCHANAKPGYTSWLGATYIHPTPTGVCVSCHNGTTTFSTKIPRGKSATHVPTTAACEICHIGTTTFLGAKFHTPTNTNPGLCATCHNGTTATGKNAGHVTTAAACDTCHANAKPAYANWLGASYIHAFPSGTCATCHTGTSVFGSKTPSGKSALHVPTGEACDTCHANAKISYLNWLGWTYIHPAPMVDACETCHRTGGFALAKSAAHVPTSAACDICHTPATIANYTTFLGAKFVHISPVGACANCHYAGGPGLVGSVNHIPTTAACEQCHNNALTGNFTTFMGAVFHTPANVNPGVCSTCHNGAIASGKSTAHVPTTAACSVCHNATNTNSYKTFFGAIYVHPTPPGVCANCHNGAIATGMSVTHIPINGAACDTCHNATNTNGYKTFFGATYVHANPAGTCSTCHNGLTALGKNAMHVVTTAACDVCHTPTNTTNFTTFKGGNYPHPTTGVAGLCSTCHNGITATGVTPYHVQVTAECDTCHAASVTNGYKTFFGGIYNHPTSGLAACSSCHDGLKARGPSAVHITTNGAPCDTCHKNATPNPTVNFTSFSVNVVFVHGATPGVCSTCHTGINGIKAKGMSAAIPSHVPTSVACDTCHANAKPGYTSWLGATYIHPSATGACETCHNGNTVFSTKKPRGKPLTHVPTTAACETCHLSTASFLGAAYVHPVPAGVCESCHNGAYPRAYAKSNTPNHVPTSAACDTCHKGAGTSYPANGWATAVTYIHANPAGTCATCHNGTTIFGPTSTPKGKTLALHVTTNATCDLCHTQSLGSQSWTQPLPTYVHETPPGVCSSCHKPGGPGMNMSINHVVINPADDCVLCHTQANTANFTSFLGAVFVHSTTPGVCSDCHKPGGPGLDKSPAHVVTTAPCDTCHTQANTKNYLNFLGAIYVHPNPPGVCDTCHNGTTARGKLANHVVTIAACDVCHTQTNTANFTTFLGGFYPHPTTGVAGLCSTCHNGTTATGKPSFHIAYTPTQECDACHTVLNTNTYKTFFGAFYDHSINMVNGTLAACETCHGVSPSARPKSANHVATNLTSCLPCHDATNTANFTTFLGARYIHNLPTAGTCTTCHNGITARTKSVTHVATTVACDVCHENDVAPKDFTSFSVKFKYVHAAIPGACSTCHNGVSIYGPSTAPQGKIAAMPIHVTTTAACDTCHANAKTTYASWAGAAYIHATPAGVCSTCHNGTSIYGTKTPNGKSATHVPTTATCDKCHTKTNTGNYTTWFGATFIHLTPVGTCSTCHSGITYGSLAPQGKAAAKPLHVPTTAQCSVCHTKTNTLNYTTFAGGNIYVHATPAGTCATCHNGTSVFGTSTTPMGKSAIHVPTLQRCDLCHTKTITSSYKFWTAVYVHETTPGVCTNCHGGTWTYSGTAPRSKASAVPTHAPTNEACDLCHTKTNTSNYTTFTGAVWTHINPGGLCNTCHIDGQLFPLAKGKQPGHFVTTAQCDTCHTQTNTLNYTTFLGAYFAHPSTVAGTCSNCHNGAIALGKPSWHMLTTEQCDVCHTQTNTSNYMTFNGATINVDHTLIGPGDCLRCHNGSGAKGVINAPGHIPVAGIQCDGCHDKYNGTTVVTFGLRAMNHVLTAATRCDACHNGSYTTQGPLGAMGKVTKHIPTTITGSLDCTACHHIAVSASVATMTWTTQVMNHNGAQGGGVPILCITCHFTGTTYQGSMQKKSHEGASATKDCSSAGCHRPRGTEGVVYQSW